MQRFAKRGFVRCVSSKTDERNEHYNLIPKRAFTPGKNRLPIRVVRRRVEPVDLSHKVHCTATVLQVGPFTTIPDSKDAVCDSDGAALLDAQCSSPVEACPEHVHANSTILCRSAIVKSLERHAVLESTFFHELFAWNVVVGVRHAHGEAEIDLWVGVLTGSAEFEHISEAFLGTVHAGDAVVLCDTVFILVDAHQ